jgi:putative membrane protein insertion efficiency factor
MSATRPSAAARVLDRLIRAYQYLAAGRPSPCRYVPSCSEYAREAVAAHGAVRGGWYAARRLGRCHPWGAHGYDPVPGTTDPAPLDPDTPPPPRPPARTA